MTQTMIDAGRLLALLAFATMIAVAAPRAAEDGAKPAVFQTEGVAIRGYDPVAYFVEGKPVEGSADYTADYEGATWHFASAANRDLFAADPAKYAPAYGGYCAYGMAQGGKVPIDPNSWKIVDEVLYLNVNPKIQGWWEADIPGFIAKADEQWTTVKHQ